MGALSNADVRLLNSWSPREIAGQKFSGKPYGVRTNGAAQLTSGNNEFLNIANNAEVAGAVTGWWRSFWIRLDSVPSTGGNNFVVCRCWDNGVGGFYVQVRSADDKISLVITDAGGDSENVWGSALVADRWYHVYIEYDGTTSRISVDDGTALTDTDGFVAATTDDFSISQTGVTGFDGRVGTFSGGDGVLSTEQRAWEFNHAAGRGWDEIQTVLGSTGEALFCWPLHEDSGQRDDVIGTHHLSDNNTVTGAPGVVARAASFDASLEEYFSIDSNDSLLLTQGDFSIAVWVYLDSSTGSMKLVSKGSTGNTREYALEIQADNTASFRMSNDGGTSTFAVVTTDTLADATWGLITAWWDASEQTAYININDGTPVSSDFGFDALVSSNALNIGRRSNGTKYLDGRLEDLVCAKTIWTAAQRKWLWNFGRGRHASDVGTRSDSIPVPVSWWPFNEESGERADAIGDNDLTDNNSVTQAPGVVQGSGHPVVNLAPVYTWEDQTPGFYNDARGPETHSEKPLYTKTGGVGGFPGIVFDGVDDWLDLTGLEVASGDLSALFVMNAHDAVAGAIQYLFDAESGRLVLAHILIALNDEPGYFDGASVEGGAAISGDQVLLFVLKAAASGAIYRDGAALTTGENHTQKALGGAVTLCSHFDGAQGFFDGVVSEADIHTGAWSTANVTRVLAYAKRYGTIA